MTHYKMYVDGEWRDSSSKKPVLNVYTGKKIATYAESSQEDVALAVASAKKSFEENELSPYKRFEILSKAAKLLLEHEEEIAQSICAEAGRLLKESRGEVKRTALAIELAAEEAKRISGEMVPVDAMPGTESKMCFTLRVPVGVVCAITPFNVPLSLTVHKVCPAIAAGNTVVLKPTQSTPGFAVKLVEILLAAGLPAKHISLVLGGGSTVGEALLKNQDIAFYTFTGSKDVGEHIKNTIGLRRCSMELGSNAAVIVHKDAPDVNAAASACAGKGFANAGQVCMKPQRLYVHQDILEAFTKQAVAVAQKLVVGDPVDPATDVGPMVKEEEVNRVDAWVKEAVAQGAKVLAGGEKVGSHCYKPTILTDVKKGMKVVDAEIFGPVVVIIPYTDFDSAIAQANDTIYGLQAGVYTANIGLAMKAAKRIQAGGVIINDTSFTRSDNMPYGGIKKSSAGGKEGPKYVIEAMTDVKTIFLSL
ncbi:aldehyde dehydrogenase [Synergistales bacterium]|nr:aldehyde dehydrogenase [Synergistales bacterium]